MFLKSFRVYKIISSIHQRKAFLALLSLIILSAVLEIFGIGSMLPLLSVILSKGDAPVVIHAFSFTSQFILLAVFLIFVTKNALSLLVLIFQTKLLQRMRHLLSVRLFRSYLFMPYLRYQEKHVSYFIFLCFGQVNEFVHAYVSALCNVMSEFLVLGGIFLFLLIVSPAITLFGGAILVMIVYLFSRYSKKFLIAFGHSREQASIAISKYIKEGLESLKEVRIFASEEQFVAQFERSSILFSHAHTNGYVLQNCTRMIFEVVMIIFLVGGVVISRKLHMEGAQFLSNMALFGAAMFRIMPSFNRISGSIAMMRTNEVTIGSICAELDGSAFQEKEKETTISTFKESLNISNISFTYPDKKHKALHTVSFEVARGQHIGVVGKSGSGKTTLIDVLLGIIPPDEGDILIDGISIQDETVSWRHLMGYVPQLIGLLDDTIKRNVAFGMSDESINMKQLEQCIEQAQLTEFIHSLPDGLNTIIGDRGIKLSGGQRQRIAIARALYRNPDILIFDEATSALDLETEHLITQELFNIGKDKTLIVIAHRLSTIKQCDYLILMEHGHIKDKGTFDELTTRNQWFSDIQNLSLEKK